MYNLDEEKFIEIFTDLVVNDEIIPYEERYFPMIREKLNQGQIDNFKSLLQKKAVILGDDKFYDWYDNLTFDQLEQKDIDRYKLPESKIIIKISLINELAIDMCNAIKEAYQGLIPKIKNTNLNAYYVINGGGFRFCIFSKALKLTTNEKQTAVKAFKSLKNNWKEITDKFNQKSGEDGVHVNFAATSSDNTKSNKADYNRGGLVVGATFEWSIDFDAMDSDNNSVNIFYKNKNKVEKSILKQLFYILPDEEVYYKDEF